MDQINQFLTWSMLANYGMFVGIVFMVVQVIKELPKLVNIPTRLVNIPTRLVSIIVAFILQIFLNVQNGNFRYMDIVLYLISSIVISLTANGVHDATIKMKTDETEVNQ